MNPKLFTQLDDPCYSYLDFGMDHLIFIYISPSKQQRNIVQLCTRESHNNLQPTSGRFMESSINTSLPSYLLQKARCDKDAHILELCVWEVYPVKESKSQTKHQTALELTFIWNNCTQNTRKMCLKRSCDKCTENTTNTTGTHQCQWYALCLLFTCTALCTVQCTMYSLLSFDFIRYI